MYLVLTTTVDAVIVMYSGTSGSNMTGAIVFFVTLLPY